MNATAAHPLRAGMPELPRRMRRRIRDIVGGRVELGRYYVDLDANDEVNKAGGSVHARALGFRSDPRLKGML